jgi:hypothetical protein
MQAASSANSPSATPETSLCSLLPPSCCSVTSSPTVLFTSAGPPTAMLPISFTIGT